MADIARLESVLDSAYAALMSGNIPALVDLGAETESLLAANGSDDQALAARLARKARRNERLLAAAIMGVKAARRRAQDLTDSGRFSTYDAGGQRNQPGLSVLVAQRRL